MGAGGECAHSFVVDPRLAPRDRMRHRAKEIGSEAKLPRWEKVIANSITVSAD